jgi:nucleotide sugar dehydrogenase
MRKYLYQNNQMPRDIQAVMQQDFISIPWGISIDETLEALNFQLKARGWKTRLPVRFVPVLRNQVPVGIINARDFERSLARKRDLLIVIGLGYVGLTFSLAAAAAKRTVIGLDSSANKIAQLQARTSYVSEPGINGLLEEQVESNFFPVSNLTGIQRASGQTCSFVLCVGTPFLSNETLDSSQLDSAIRDAIPFFRPGDAIVIRSTVPVGTSKRIAKVIESALGWKVGTDFFVISAPERTVEGNALEEIKNLPQVIGGVTKACLQRGLEMFQDISNHQVPVSNAQVAELIKISSNAYRDYSFGFANYLALVAYEFELDINEVIENANYGYPRNSISLPSPGVGGPCLSKDPYLLTKLSNVDLESPIYHARKVNEFMPSHIYKLLASEISEFDLGKTLLVGVAFKGRPETNDVRNSSSIDLAGVFASHNLELSAWDCVATYDTYSFAFSEYNPNFPYSVFILMNNHEKNLDFVMNAIRNSSEERIYLFDPWRLVKIPDVLSTELQKELHYYTLSNLYGVYK